MGKSAGNSLKELEQRKKRIEAELHQIQYDVDSSVDSMKERLLSTLLPVKAIQKKPFKAIGIAIIAGFALGLPKVGKFRVRRKEKSKNSGGNPGVTSLMLEEFKRIAARRAVQLFMDTVDEQLEKRKSRSSESGRDKNETF